MSYPSEIPSMPSIESRLEELLRRGEDMRTRGEPVSAEELCRDCPELVMLLRARMEGEPLTKPREDTSPTSQPPARSYDNDDLHIGSEPIAGYKLVLRLGRGGYGEVWKAIAPGGFAVALKFVPLATDGLQVEQRALDIIRTLRHPCLLTTVGSWQTNRYLVIAMELADRTLKDRFQEAVRQGYIGIPREEVLEYFHEAAKGLDFLNDPRHPYDGQERVSFQHRDIKPENILLVGGGAKVADFGLVRLLEQAQTSHTGSMTPIYAAPEFFEGHTSQHSDQYSLAITYCHLRGGRVPFVGSLADVMRGHLKETPDLSMLPPEERSIVGRALSKVPTQRWPNCVTLISELRNCLTKKSGAPAANLSGATYKPAAGSQATAMPPASSHIVRSQPAKRRGLGFVVFSVLAVCAVVAVAMNESSRDYLKDLFAEKKSDEKKGEEKKTDDKKESTADAEAAAKKSTEVAKAVESAPASVATNDKTPPALPVAPALPSDTARTPATVAEKPPVDPPKVTTNPKTAKLEAPALLNPNQEPQAPSKDDSTKPTVPAPSVPGVAATGTPTPPIIPPAPPTPTPTVTPESTSPPASTATATPTPKATTPPTPSPALKEAPPPVPRSVRKPGETSDPKVIAAVTPAVVTPKEPPAPLKSPFNEVAAKTAQQAWATYAGRPVVETNSIGMELTLIPPGEFSIGMDPADVTRPPHALPPQKAVIKSPFSFGTTEVTQGQWFRVMQTQPWSTHRMKNDNDLPAAWITWTEANQFCSQLTKLEQEKGQLGKQARYQLPSEAEWEWSCRAGTVSKFSCTDAELAQYCWYENNADGELHPVRKLKPNPFNLYDMHGNMAEWCRDNFLSPGSLQLSKGYLHGGNWKRTARHCASAARDPLAIDSQHSENGFRVVRTEQP
jgi:formylglycine-generating enzyme required for sulfatase activity/serine/threonine protein kinase